VLPGRFACLSWLAVLASGCGLIDLSVEGAQCSVDHPCPAGLACLEGACTSPDASVPVFADDFEHPTLLGSDQPPGPWGRSMVAAGNSISIVSAAAHRGDGGFRAIDVDTQDVFPAFISRSRAWAGDQSVRTWVRVVTTNHAGDSSLLKSDEPTFMFGQWEVDLFPDGQLRALSWLDAQNAISDFSDAGVLVPGQWRLLEVLQRGAQTPDASLEVFVDGVREVALEHYPGTLTSGAISAGIFFQGTPAATLTLDLDDLRIADEPQPTRLRLTPVRHVSGKACAEYRLEALDVFGAPRAAPYALEVSSASSLFGDADCSRPLGPMPRGALGVALFARADDASLRVSHPDLLSSAPVAPAPASCSSTSASPWLLLALLVARRRRPRVHSRE
jgi:hypothetical protein